LYICKYCLTHLLAGSSKVIDKIRGAADICLKMTMTRNVRLPPMVI